MSDADPSDAFLAGARAAAPIALAVAVFGASFGVLAPAAGFSPAAALIMSATTFAGSAQFAAVSVLAEGGSLAAAVAAALLLNARYGPIGLSAAPALRGGPVRRFFAAQLLVDESWAIAAGTSGRIAPRRLLGAGVALYLGWVAGTAIGLAAGTAVASPAELGLDAAFPALFLGLLAPRLRSPAGRRAAAAGAVIGLALTPVAPPGVPIIAAALGAFTAAGRS